ncbi:unnamed protein product [Didymodactylos carnosus]|uniref:Uncharacterized protein n=1 Tax=Didymodactylos carnosus TaxID=1234261 RepID=A0A815BEU0_9BILA|nr:unnamed protein product [Didymodactylos carnosus]CAF4058187.1 unnamed protein product [Didymodactylos carnosus]
MDNYIGGDANSSKSESETMDGVIVTILGAYNRGKSFLRATDQIYIKQILKYCKSTNKKTGIIIVHNLLDLSTVHDVTTIIEEEVKSVFEATEDEMQISVNGSHRTIRFFKSIQEGIHLRYFILAKAESESEAAKRWNTQSFDGVMNIFQASSEYKRHLDIISSMINFINDKLPQLLLRDNSENSNPQQSLQIVQYNNQPYIVLSDRKDLEDLKQDSPYKLELVKPIVYDDSGYFIRHESSHWQPRHNLYGNEDHICAIFELPGVKQKDVKNLKIRENSIFIEGIRSDLKMSPTYVVLHQSEIPSGSFKLEIPLPRAVDLDSAEAERERDKDRTERSKAQKNTTQLIESNT